MAWNFAGVGAKIGSYFGSAGAKLGAAVGSIVDYGIGYVTGWAGGGGYSGYGYSGGGYGFRGNTAGRRAKQAVKAAAPPPPAWTRNGPTSSFASTTYGKTQIAKYGNVISPRSDSYRQLKYLYADQKFNEFYMGSSCNAVRRQYPKDIYDVFVVERSTDYGQWISNVWDSASNAMMSPVSDPMCATNDMACRATSFGTKWGETFFNAIDPAKKNDSVRSLDDYCNGAVDRLQ